MPCSAGSPGAAEVLARMNRAVGQAQQAGYGSSSVDAAAGYRGNGQAAIGNRGKGCVGHASSSGRTVLLDSGASYHMAGDAHQQESQPADAITEINTVNGTIELYRTVTQTVPGVGSLDSLLAPGSPDLASMGRLLRENPYAFL